MKVSGYECAGESESAMIVYCKCGHPIQMTQTLDGYTFDADFRDGDVPGEIIDHCPGCGERLWESLEIEKPSADHAGGESGKMRAAS
jgi:hypothetical protein